MGIAIRLGLQIFAYVSHAFHRGGCQRFGQSIRGEPAHVEAFLIADERLRVAIRIGPADEQVIHVHGVVPIRIGEDLSGRFDRHQIGDDHIHAGLLLDLAGNGIGRFLSGLVDAIHHGPFAGVGTTPQQHTALLVLDIAGDAHEP